MKKRLISLILTAVTLISVLCPMVHADDSTDFGTCSHDWQTPIVHGYSITIPNSDVSFGVEFQQCSKCHWYKHEASIFIVSATYYSPLAPDLNGIVPKELITYWCNKYYEVFGQNASAKQYETGGGSAGTGGAGRRPSGYADDSGTPTFNSSGQLQIVVYPNIGFTFGNLQLYPDISLDNTTKKYAFALNGLNGSIRALTSNFSSCDGVDLCFEYQFIAPVSGRYYLKTRQPLLGPVMGKDGAVNTWHFNANQISIDYVEGETASFASTSSYVCVRPLGYGENESYSFRFYPLTITCRPDTTTINKQTNITINNNTWNGNIYQDNSTNLTYIYPQYTTINENNETVTNISENPIIYDSTTNQYYTYDSVTNNYYYITYVTETPTPTPSPDPTPTPDPGTDPIPTPEPGGDTGDTSSILDVLVEIRDNMIQGFADLKATLVQGWADLSANFTLAIENLNLNITNIFNKKFPDQSTPETARPSPSPSLSPEPVDPILPDTQNYIIPKMNSNTFTDEHGTWIASGSSKYSDVFDFFRAFDRSTSEIWETNVSPSYLQIEIPDPENYYIDGYIMRISKFDNRYPKDWTLQGSDDGEAWDDLDTQTGQNLSDKAEHKYTLTLRKAYKYYRVNMSNYASSMCSLSHFNLLGYDAEDVVTPTPSPSPTPDPGTDPTPAPTDKPSNGSTNNFWNFVFPGGNDDGTENGHKGILWALISLLIAVVTFVLGLGSAYSYVFPFLPAGLVTTIHICVLVLLLFAIIKFVRSFL